MEKRLEFNVHCWVLPKVLQEVGYNEREAAFLVLAALHSGYFVRRQYRRFVRCRQGKAVVQLAERMAANSHCSVTVFPNNTGVFHLSSRPLFEALGDPKSRNRRRRSPSAVKTKLMALDFVLADPERNFLATEREKVDYFENHRKISPTLQRSRYGIPLQPVEERWRSSGIREDPGSRSFQSPDSCGLSDLSPGAQL